MLIELNQRLYDTLHLYLHESIGSVCTVGRTMAAGGGKVPPVIAFTTARMVHMAREVGINKQHKSTFTEPKTPICLGEGASVGLCFYFKFVLSFLFGRHFSLPKVFHS